MNIEKIKNWIILGCLLCIFDEVLFVVLIVIAVKLAIEIVKTLKKLKGEIKDYEQ